MNRLREIPKLALGPFTLSETKESKTDTACEAITHKSHTCYYRRSKEILSTMHWPCPSACLLLSTCNLKVKRGTGTLPNQWPGHPVVEQVSLAMDLQSATHIVLGASGPAHCTISQGSALR